MKETPSPSAIGRTAAAGDRSAGVRIGVERAGLRPGGPAADAQRAEGRAARQREIGRAEADRGGDEKREQCSEQQAHEMTAGEEP